jgi:uridine phosphorylase
VTFPLLEHDADPTAIVPPRPLRTVEPFPARAVLCFFHDVLAARAQAGRARPIGRFSTEVGGHPVYLVDSPAGPVAAFHPGVGAALAAIHLETAIASGGRAFVACGGAGAVRPGLALGHVVVPTGAVRDEGTSFHYAPPSRTIATDAAATTHLIDVLRRHDRPHTTGLTWTTDGLFRETPGRIRTRRAEGCLTVEMETAALAAVAAFRGVAFGQYLYAGDDVSGPQRDHRRWTSSEVRGELFDLAVEAVATLSTAATAAAATGTATGPAREQPAGA